MRQPSPFFITFEGVDGCGKSTQAALLERALVREGYPVTHTFEPGGTELGRKLRPLLLAQDGAPLAPFTELLLFAADRRQDIEEVIKPALGRGNIVIGERFTDSSIAYQGAGGGLGREKVRQLMLLVTDGLSPDLTFLLDIDPHAALARKTKLDRIEQREAFFSGVRLAFLKMAAAQPERFVVVHADQPPGDLASAILTATTERLNQRRHIHD